MTMLSRLDKMMQTVRWFIICSNLVNLSCQQSWWKAGSITYYVGRIYTNQRLAKDDCAKLGAQLVTVDSEDINKCLLSIDEVKEGLQEFFIGLERPTEDSNFEWIDGTAVENTFENWESGFPIENRILSTTASDIGLNLTFDQNEPDNCVIMYGGFESNFEWRNVHCLLYYARYICEKESDTMPGSTATTFSKVLSTSACEASSGKPKKSPTPNNTSKTISSTRTGIGFPAPSQSTKTSTTIGKITIGTQTPAKTNTAVSSILSSIRLPPPPLKTTATTIKSRKTSSVITVATKSTTKTMKKSTTTTPTPPGMLTILNAATTLSSKTLSVIIVAKKSTTKTMKKSTTTPTPPGIPTILNAATRLSSKTLSDIIVATKSTTKTMKKSTTTPTPPGMPSILNAATRLSSKTLSVIIVATKSTTKTMKKSTTTPTPPGILPSILNAATRLSSKMKSLSPPVLQQSTKTSTKTGKMTNATPAAPPKATTTKSSIMSNVTPVPPLKTKTSRKSSRVTNTALKYTTKTTYQTQITAPATTATAAPTALSKTDGRLSFSSETKFDTSTSRSTTTMENRQNLLKVIGDNDTSWKVGVAIIVPIFLTIGLAASAFLWIKHGAKFSGTKLYDNSTAYEDPQQSLYHIPAQRPVRPRPAPAPAPRIASGLRIELPGGKVLNFGNIFELLGQVNKRITTGLFGNKDKTSASGLGNEEQQEGLFGEKDKTSASGLGNKEQQEVFIGESASSTEGEIFQAPPQTSRTFNSSASSLFSYTKEK